MLINFLRSPSFDVYDIVGALFSSLIVVFVCIPFREFICAFTATKLGDYTPRLNGRLTINPLVHIHPFGAIMMVLFGFGFGKGVPYNPYRFKKPKQGVLIMSIVGPVSLLVFGFFFFALYEIIGYFFALSSEFGAFITQALYLISYLNVGLAVFYLLPIPPLDGSHILFYFLPDRITYSLRSYERYFPYILMLLIFSGVLDYPLMYAKILFLNLFDLITFWI